MRISVPKESRRGETRVAATPKTVAQLIGLGYQVDVEKGAGAASSYPDEAYTEAGAAIVTRAKAWKGQIVAKVNAPSDDEIGKLSKGQTLISLIAPAINPALTKKLSAAGVTTLALDAVPRISRAQSLDVLSSMANLGGYRAVIEAAHEFGSLFTGQVTAAGKVPPAKVFISGAGVAGLAAIGTANSLGAIVRATDVRPEVAEQVESMGAEFVAPEGAGNEVSSDGYAKEATKDYADVAQRMYAEQAADCDIIVTTALIPGKPAPRLITAKMIKSMKPGSVIVDMAAINGGNVEGSVVDQKVVTDNGVIILGYSDMAGRLPTQASQLFGTNIVNLLKMTTPEKDGELVLDQEDVVVRGMTVTDAGAVTWPPPAVQVSAAPAAAAAPVAPPVKEEKKPLSTAGLWTRIAIGAALFLLLSAYAPAAFLPNLTVFVLAVVIGYYVIGHVHHALHTPLMSVTNAISGIIVVGALLQVTSGNLAIQIIAAVAILLASINVFGGFTVTNRMLNMFKKA